MIPLYRKIVLKALKLFDLLIMVFCFALAIMAVYYQTGGGSLVQSLFIGIKV